MPSKREIERKLDRIESENGKHVDTDESKKGMALTLGVATPSIVDGVKEDLGSVDLYEVVKRTHERMEKEGVKRVSDLDVSEEEMEEWQEYVEGEK